MKHAFIAKEDINRRAGNVLITAKAGEKITLNDREAAAASTFEELEYAGPQTETKAEETFVETQFAQVETKEDLMKLKREELVAKAEALGIAVNSDTKDELATAILVKREENALQTKSPDFDDKESE